MKIIPTSEDISCAREFLAATMQFLMIDLANCFPGEFFLNKDDPKQKTAQTGAEISYGQLMSGDDLVHFMVAFGIAEYIPDGSFPEDSFGAFTVRVIIPFEQVAEHILNCDDDEILEKLLSDWDPDSSRGRWSNHPEYFPARLRAYCWAIVRQNYSRFDNRRPTYSAPLPAPYEIDLATEFYVLASRDIFESWAVKCAAEVEQSLLAGDPNLSPFRIEGVGQ